MKNLISIITLILTFAFSQNANADNKCSDYKCKYEQLLNKYNKLLNKQDIITKLPIKPKPRKVMKRPNINPLKSLFDGIDDSVSRGQHNKVVRNALYYHKKFNNKLNKYAKYIRRYNDWLKKRNDIAKEVNDLERSFKKKRAKVHTTYQFKSHIPIVDTLAIPNIVVFVDNSMLAIFDYLRKPSNFKYAPHSKKRVSRSEYNQALTYYGKTQTAYEKMKHAMREVYIKLPKVMKDVKLYSYIVVLWRKKYDAMVRLELYLNKDEVKKQLRLCQHMPCNLPDDLKLKKFMKF